MEGLLVDTYIFIVILARIYDLVVFLRQSS